MKITEICENVSKIKNPVFRGGKISDGLSFYSSDKNFAADYGDPMAYKLLINNPFDSTNVRHIEMLMERVGNLIDPYDGTEYETAEEFIEKLQNDTWESIEEYVSEIQGMGFDSIIITEGGIVNYIVFDKSDVIPH